MRRARFTPAEVVQLTLDFYRRNYIEGLFLSSGIIRNPDYTMEQVVKVNPARVKVHAMQKEMPKRYWKNLPEAELIPGLIAQAPERVETMLTRSQTQRSLGG